MLARNVGGTITRPPTATRRSASQATNLLVASMPQHLCGHPLTEAVRHNFAIKMVPVEIGYNESTRRRHSLQHSINIFWLTVAMHLTRKACACVASHTRCVAGMRLAVATIVSTTAWSPADNMQDVANSALNASRKSGHGQTTLWARCLVWTTPELEPIELLGHVAM